MDGKESVLTKFDSHKGKLVHWKIYYGYSAIASQLTDTTENHIGELDENLSRKKLEEAIDRLDPGEYLIQYKKTPSDSNNIVNQRFKIGYTYGTGTQQNQNQNPAIRGWVSPEQVELRVQNELLKRDLDDFRKEIIKVQEEKSGALKDLIPLVRELAPVIRGLFGAPQTEARPIRVLGPQLNNEEQQAAQERRTYFLKLSNEATSGLYDPNDFGEMAPGEHMIVFAWCVNEYRKANPEMFKALKPELLKYAEKLEEQG